MRLNREWASRSRECEWAVDYSLPKFDIHQMIQSTKEAPTWLQVGAGNIFRILVAGVQQDLLDAELTDTGILVYEGYDEEIITKAFTPFDNISLGVTLHADGSMKKRVIASVADAFYSDTQRLCQIISQQSLQIISTIITEKGYIVDSDKVCDSPLNAITTLEQVVAGLFSRFNQSGKPLALLSMDNFAENGTRLANAVLTIAQAWKKNNSVPAEFITYVKSMSYPWTMIDKITPRPSEEVAEILAREGLKDLTIHKTAKHTFVSSFVNAESAQYLVIEDDFPNGRPPLEKAGVYMTNRETVRKVDQMKVCACLNPLHTILAISGMLLNLPTIAECMKDKRLVKLIKTAAEEALPVVSDPKIINPSSFLNEVLTERFPNPFIPDTPERIACDTSQKIPIRFGETLKSLKPQDLSRLEAIPIFIALWLRYRMGFNDGGEIMELSPDPQLPKTFNMLHGLPFGKSVELKPILSDNTVFGIDLYEVGLGGKIEDIFAKLSAKPMAVSQELDELLSN
ncbi:MAG: mannitol dehydrogenase family protein [Defluviitaleaceae bacterium]|nr:mannitol dehydrogenase family protein [Defluviitaleaceae bacterium]